MNMKAIEHGGGRTGIRGEVRMWRYISLTMDLGTYLVPTMQVGGCMSDHASGDHLVIPSHSIEFKSGMVGLGLAMHF